MVRLVLFLALVAMAVGAGLYLVSERRAIAEAESDVAALELEKRQKEDAVKAATSRKARLMQLNNVRKQWEKCIEEREKRIERSEKRDEERGKQDNKDNRE